MGGVRGSLNTTFDIQIIMCDCVDMASREQEKQAALAALHRFYRRRVDADEALTQAVVDARHLGVTWRRVAEVLGKAQPNVTRKYKPAVDSRRPTGWDEPADPTSPLAEGVVRKERSAAAQQQVMERLRMAAAVVRRLEETGDAEELRLVAAARTAGATWAEVGEQLGGMAAPNAVAKYGPKLVHRVEVREPAG